MDNVINIIDREFNFLGQIDNYDSLIMTKKWHGIGGLELHLHENATHAEQLQKENIIFARSNKAYVILHRELNSTDGKLIVKGLEIKSYLARWLVFPPKGQAYYRINSNIETIMKKYVQATLNRKGITNIVVAENQNRGLTTVYQSRYKNLAEELEKLSLASGLGWDITLDLENKKFVFDVMEGQDRTANQDILPPTIFSIEYDNIAEQKLIESKLSYANTAIVAGQGEGAERQISIVGDEQGLDSFELFVDARDLENANDLPARGEQKLAEVKEIFTFDSRVLTDKNLIYEEDFNLGDLVTIQNSKWSVTADRRITELTEIYESSGFRLDVTFGESLPGIIEKVKRIVDTPAIEDGKKGEPGAPGEDGTNGVGIEYSWNGTELGIKREDELNYSYMNLKGEKGDKGDRGEKGERGEPGDQGIQGPQGIQGKTGPMGPQGKSIEYVWSGTKLGVRVEGETSYTYVDLRGPQGLKGDTGPQGIQGPKGDIGPVGPQGPIGLTGPKGNTGAKGDKPNHRWVSQTQIQFENPDGTWGEIIDLNPDTILIHQEHFISTEGQEIFNLTKGAYRLGTNSVIWYLDGIKQSNDAIEELSPTSVKIKGGVPSGSTVLVEYIEFTNVAIGLKGEKGDKGDIGPMGPQGPKGDTGEQGIQGPKGDTGPKGLKGDKGDSAYQVWLNQGNTGTMDDYLLSLKGEKGERGPQGIQGPKGDAGPQGPKGNDGYTPVKGVDYFDGAKGEKGDTGPIGPVGPKGDTGARGPEGPQGPPGKDGSDANVTKENVISAIGYTPANSVHKHDISSEITGNLPTDRLSEPSYMTGSVTRTARPLFDVLRGDRIAFLPETQIIIEKSIDGGVTWEDAQISDSTKRKLFTGQRPNIRIPLKNGVKSCDCMIRITITGMRYKVPAGTSETEKYNYWNSDYVQSAERYFSAQEGWTWVSSNSDRIYLKVERATGGNSTNWILDREAYLSGWSGGNYFSLSGNTFGGGITQINNYWNWRFTFRTCTTKNTFNDAELAAIYPASAQTVYHLKVSGRNVWNYSNNYMYHDHLYNWDEFQNAIFPAEIKATTFRKSDGTEVAYKPDIPTKVSQLTNDEGYLKTLPGHNHIANEVKFTDGETFQQKLDLGKLTGPQGPQGIQGPKGEQGIQGPRGYTGPKGDTGLQGPKGDKGDVGPQGPPGTTTWAGITDRPTKLSQFQNDLVIESGGTKIITSATEPNNLAIGDQWHREY